MNFFKLYIGDYQRDTAHLSVTEHGAYLLMLQHYYATEKPLPTGKALHRMLRAQDRAEREAIDMIAAKFWTLTDDGLVNTRGAEEIEKAAHQRTVNQEVGKLGGRPKRTESVSESETESVSETDPNRNPNQTPDTRHQTEIHPPTPRKRGSVHEFPPGFDEFWKAYPRKVGKDAALKAYARRGVDRDLLATMLAAIAKQRQSRQWTTNDGQFIPHPATWLSEGRWMDGEQDDDPYGLRHAL